MQIAEASLQERVGVAADDSPYLARQDITIDDSTQHVVVRGVVSSYYEKQMAQEILLRIDGVDSVENHLEVMRRRVR